MLSIVPLHLHGVPLGMVCAEVGVSCTIPSVSGDAGWFGRTRLGSGTRSRMCAPTAWSRCRRAASTKTGGWCATATSPPPSTRCGTASSRVGPTPGQAHHRVVPVQECPYHGWAFSGSGRCESIPQGGDPSSFKSAATAYPCIVKQGRTRAPSTLCFL